MGGRLQEVRIQGGTFRFSLRITLVKGSASERQGVYDQLRNCTNEVKGLD